MSLSAANPDIWSAMDPASYKADGGELILFPARSAGERGGNRIARRERPWQAGAKLDAIGSKPDELTIEALFHNDIIEPGLGESPALYPDRLDALVAAFKLGTTATLNLPWKRNLRVKADSWDRRATADDTRGGEVLTVTFITDSEDNLDREAFERVSAKANVNRVAEAATFTMKSIGAWDGSIEDITQFASELQGYLNAPGEYLSAIAHRAKRIRRAVTGLMGALSTAVPGRGQLADPEGSNARLQLLELLELAAAAEEEARASLPKTRSVTFARARDIYSIATEVGQDPRVLISINSALEDPGYIEAGTPVLVLAS